MITIGQLARYVGVSVKTVRVYHAKGLLPEPERDSSGYRRYGADDIVALIKVRTLAEAGLPLARVRQVLAASEEDFRGALAEVDDDLDRRIRTLLTTRTRLCELVEGRSRLLPPDVEQHLASLRDVGFTDRWVALERDLWILTFATHPDLAPALYADQADALTDPDQLRLYLDYDSAHDLNPHDPRLEELAERIVRATQRRYGTGDLPGQDTGSDIPALVQGAVNATSPAWARLDALIRSDLGRRSS